MSWPWIFYINVPVGLLAAGLTWGIYSKRDTPIGKLPIDTVGLTLLVLWVGALQLMLDKGKELDWFSSNQIIVLLSPRNCMTWMGNSSSTSKLTTGTWPGF